MDSSVEDIFGAAPSPQEAKRDADSADGGVVQPGGNPEKSNPAPMCSLASFVMDNFVVNADARRNSNIDWKLEYALKTHACEYDGVKQAKLASAGIPKELFSPITFTKNRAAKAMLVDLVNAADDPLFLVSPTPNPEVGKEVAERTIEESMEDVKKVVQEIASSGVRELPPDAMSKLQDLVNSKAAPRYDSIANAETEEAENRARRMQRRIWDVMVEGGFKKAFWSYVDNICVYGTGVIVGPVMRAVASNKIVRDVNGVKKYERVLKVKPVFESVNPMDCYPAPDAEEVEDGPFCIRVKYAANALSQFVSESDKSDIGIDADGWNSGNVRELLARHPGGGVHLSDERYSPERREAEGKDSENPRDCRFEGVRCFASVSGRLLLEMGIVKNRDGEPIIAGKYYKTETIVIDGLVVYCRIYDDRIDVPVSRGKFYEIPGSWWGESIASKLFMCQYVQNSTVKDLVRNMAVASGAQIWIQDAQRLVDRSPEALKLKPWKAWAFGMSPGMASGAPMGVLSVPSNASELIAVFKEFRSQADLDSGIPAFTEGQSSAQGGALRTSSGLAMYTEASNRGMKMVMTTTDNHVIARIAKMCADLELVYGKDMDVKGDVEVKPVGLIGRILKAQRDEARKQVLAMCLNSQFLVQILGVKGILALFRPTVNGVDVNPDDVVPNEERMKELELIEQIKQIVAAQMPQQQGQEQMQTGAGAPPGVELPQSPQQPGGVAERRGVA